MKLLIDGDSIACKAAGAAQWRDPDTGILEYLGNHMAEGNTKHMMQSIFKACGTADHNLYLSLKNDPDSFRKKLYPQYKANRTGYRPYYDDVCRSYLMCNYNTELVSKIEADDKVCMEQYKYNSNGFITTFVNNAEKIDFNKLNISSCIVGIDKDLDIIPGLHYNYDADRMYYVTPLEATKKFVKQILEGDVADNVPRIKYRWLKKDCFKAIDNATTEPDVYLILEKEFKAIYLDAAKEEIQMRAELLYLRRFMEDKYNYCLSTLIEK